MTTLEFNALPLEARRFIEKEMGCLSCGKKNDLDSLFKKYQQMKTANLYTLRNGAIVAKNTKGDVTILYPLNLKDTFEERKLKLELALKINKVRPDSFLQIEEVEINKILKTKKEIEQPKESE